MRLPDELSTAIQTTTNAQPLAAARALYDLDGNLGETYVVATDRSFWVCSRRVGDPFITRSWPWTEIATLTMTAENVFAHLTWTTPDRPCALKFSSWDAPRLEAIHRIWNERRTTDAPQRSNTAPETFNKSDTTEITPPGQLVPQHPPSGPVEITLTPLEFFCAAIHAMIESDDHIDLTELKYLAQRLQDKTPIQHGHAFLQQHGLDNLLANATRVLDPKQARCLFANLVAVTMLDGLLKLVEMDLLDRFQTALHIGAEDRQHIWDILLTKHRLAVFAEPANEVQPRDGLTPLTAFCAAIQAMVHADNHIAPSEQEYLERTVPDPDTIQAGKRYLATFGVEHLAARSGAVLSDDQKRCLVANLYALAMIDGAVDRREQTILDLFIRSLELAPETCHAILDLIILKNNLGVLDR